MFLHNVGCHNERAPKGVPLQRVSAVKLLPSKNRARSVFCPENRLTCVSHVLHRQSKIHRRVEEDLVCIIFMNTISWRHKVLPWKRAESHDSLTFYGVPPVLNKGKDQILYG